MAQIKITPGISRFIPDPFIPKHFFDFIRDNVSGKISIRSTIDGGDNYRVWLPEITEEVQPGYGLILDQNKNATWKPVQTPQSGGGGGGSGNGTIFVDTTFFGEPSVNQIFPGFQVPLDHSYECTGAQIIAQDAPTGGPIEIDFVNVGGTVQGRSSILSSTSTFNQTVFITPLTMLAGELWRFKFLQVGSTFSGSNITFRLILDPQ